MKPKYKQEAIMKYSAYYIRINWVMSQQQIMQTLSG